MSSEDINVQSVSGLCHNYPGMHLLDFAYLALNVYHSKKPRDLALLGKLPQEVSNLSVLKDAIALSNRGWFQIKTSGVEIPLSSHFYADLYVKVQSGGIPHVVVAVRGTDDLDNIFVDAKTWGETALTQYTLDMGANSPVPGYYHLLLTFLFKVRDCIDEMTRMNLLTHDVQYYLTGHSLGGALVNLALNEALTLRHFKTIVFNAPGVGDIEGVNRSPVVQQFSVSLRATYDYVSMIGKPYGYQANVQVPNGFADGKDAFAKMNALHDEESTKAFWDKVIQAPFYMLATHLPDWIVSDIDFCKSVMGQHSMSNMLETLINSYHYNLSVFDQVTEAVRDRGGQIGVMADVEKKAMIYPDSMAEVVA